MKKLYLLTMSLMLTACGESGTPRERAEANFHKINKACADKMGDYSRTAGLIAYNGSDRARKYKDLASAEGEDRSILNRMCYDISKLKKGSHKNSYTVMSFTEESEGDQTWYVLDIKYPNNKQAQFAFIDINGTMALGDID